MTLEFIFIVDITFDVAKINATSEGKFRNINEKGDVSLCISNEGKSASLSAFLSGLGPHYYFPSFGKFLQCELGDGDMPLLNLAERAFISK